MFTQCPQCEAVFQVSDPQLYAADGDVRCGQCLSIFNAPQHEREDLLERNASIASRAEQTGDDQDWNDDDPLFESELASGETSEIMVGDVATEVHDNPYTATNEDTETLNQTSLETGANITASPAAPDIDDLQETFSALKSDEKNWADATIDADVETETPVTPEPEEIPPVLLEELQAERAARLRPSSVPWLLGCLVLIVVFTAQVIYFKRDELARSPDLRPWLAQACELIHCTLAPPYDITQIELLGLDVHSHPEAPRALVASTALINNARIPQPFPLLTLTFSDMTSNRVAQRRFLPEEYLPVGIDPKQGMTPNLPVKITLEFSDPGEAAINFEFHVNTDPRSQPRKSTLKNPLAHLLSSL